MICDGCRVFPPHEHRCHTPHGTPGRIVELGESRQGICACDACRNTLARARWTGHAYALPPKFSDAERDACQWLQDCQIAFLVDLATKEVYYDSGELGGVNKCVNLIEYAKGRGFGQSA